MLMNSIFRCVFIGIIAIATIPKCFAAWPDKPVKLIVGYVPGGSTDIIARLLAPYLSTKWGQQVVVENKPGASGMIAGEQVARATPDGYTLLLGYTPEVSINKLVFKSMRYDPLSDLVPVVLVASAPLVLVAGPKLPVRNLRELLDLKSAGTKLTYGSPGSGGQQHMAGEMLGKSTGLQLTHIPYRGTGQAVADLLGGQIDLFFATTPPLLQHIKAGKLQPLLIAGNRRENLLPNVPTALEVGLPKLQMSNWFGVFAPKGLPANLVDKISADVISALVDPKFVKSLEEQGLMPQPIKGDEFRKFIDAEMAKYKEVVIEANIIVE